MTVERITRPGGLEPLRIEHRLSARGCHETTMLPQSRLWPGPRVRFTIQTRVWPLFTCFGAVRILRAGLC
jgi:hypothetical protein